MHFLLWLIRTCNWSHKGWHDCWFRACIGSVRYNCPHIMLRRGTYNSKNIVVCLRLLCTVAHLNVSEHLIHGTPTTELCSSTTVRTLINMTECLWDLIHGTTYEWDSFVWWQGLKGTTNNNCIHTTSYKWDSYMNEKPNSAKLLSLSLSSCCVSLSSWVARPAMNIIMKVRLEEIMSKWHRECISLFGL